MPIQRTSTNRPMIEVVGGPWISLSTRFSLVVIAADVQGQSQRYAFSAGSTEVSWQHVCRLMRFYGRAMRRF